MNQDIFAINSGEDAIGRFTRIVPDFQNANPEGGFLVECPYNLDGMDLPGLGPYLDWRHAWLACAEIESALVGATA